MTELHTTADIASRGLRFDDATEFFGQLRVRWESVKSQVVKLEIRQSYREPGNVSWEKLAAGDKLGALQLVAESRAVDVPLYNSLRARGVVFMRCRPVAVPLTAYLSWALPSYEFNAAHGEQIYFLDARAFERFGGIAVHDFMVFDDECAFVHDYDDVGQIRGGWRVERASDVGALLRLFSAILGVSMPYREYLHRCGLRLLRSE